jgi:O-antigen/teichoic acid export membrane protein
MAWAGNLLASVGLISGALSTALFSTLPSFLGEDYKLRDAVRKASAFIALVIPSIALALALFARQVVYIIYGEAYDLAPTYLMIMAMSNLLAPLGVLGMYINIIGETKVSMMLSLTNMAIGLPITWLFLVRMGMLSAVIASVINGAVGSALTVAVVKAKYGLTVDAMKITKYMAPALVSALTTYLIMRLIHGIYLQLAIGLPIYALSLAVLIAIIVSPEDLEYIAKASRDVKYLGPLLAKALTLKPGIRRLIRTTAE